MEKMNSKKSTVLVVDDEKQVRDAAVKLLKGEGYHCFSADSAAEAIRIYAKERPLVVLTDLWWQELGSTEGFVILDEVRRMDPEAVVIMISGPGTIAQAVDALKRGAFDYVQKMVSSQDLVQAVDRAVRFAKVQRENRYLRSQLDLSNDSGFLGAIGTSPAFKEVLEKAKRVAQTSATVFITGDTGTGKEVLARGMHRHSPRREHPFVPVAVGALPETLLEAELFGHTKGAFTGATDKMGLFEAADKGTIFLDEICEVNMDMQQKLLRVLQERTIRRIGGLSEKEIDVRIISATNKDPEELVREKKMRDDLYFRLNVVRIHLPLLRERSEDIATLSYHFLKQYRFSGLVEVESIHSDALLLMQQYQWPGNVRELQHTIERMVALAQKPELTVADLPEYIRPSNKKVFIPSPDPELGFKEAKAKLIEEFEKHYLERMLVKYNHNISKVAEAMGINRKTVYRSIEAHDIKTERNAGESE